MFFRWIEEKTHRQFLYGKTEKQPSFFCISALRRTFRARFIFTGAGLLLISQQDEHKC